MVNIANLPTPRAGTSTVTYEGNVVVIGGEGNGQAYSTVESLDPNTNLWTKIDSLNFARHGTQAVVSGDGIFTAGGSFKQGGGNQLNMETFNSAIPSGEERIAGTLGITQNDITIDSPIQININHTSGNQGVLITNIELVGNNAESFEKIDDRTLPILDKTVSDQPSANQSAALATASNLLFVQSS